jgi:quercetin dioxygenase-like cupin family protein
MTARLFAALAVSLLAVGTQSPAQAPKEGSPAKKLAHMIALPDDLKWGEAPPGLPPGTKMAVLSGDPTKEGSVFTVRAKFVDGAKIPPHWHSTDEQLTVIEGSFGLGIGEKFDTSKVRYLPAGTYARMDKGERHYAICKGTTVVQVTAVGPFDINFVNPEDAPKK